MPLVLPVGAIPVPVLDGTDVVLAGPRITDYRFEILDSDDHITGTLGTVTGGSVEWVSRTALHGGGTLNVADPDTTVDWLNIRIRPVVIWSRPDVPGETETALGVFLPSAPVEAWTDTGRTWAVELVDKLSILDVDIVTDLAGDPVTYTAAAGANIVTLVRALIEATGETTQAIVAGAKTVLAAMTWELGTSRLKIINDLLEAANYRSLWVDGAGQYRVEPWIDPADRPPTYALLAPFTPGASSLMAPDWTRDADIYDVPNRYVAITAGSGDTAALTSVAENLDPASPFSYPSRGRWITRVLTNAEAASQADLDTIARRGLTSTTSVSGVLTVNHAFLPELHMDDVTRFVNPDAGLDALAEVTRLTVPFDPTALCRSEMREVEAT